MSPAAWVFLVALAINLFFLACAVAGNQDLAAENHRLRERLRRALPSDVFADLGGRSWGPADDRPVQLIPTDAGWAFLDETTETWHA